MSATVRAFFDPATFSLTYVVHDPATRDAVVIDPVLDFDAPSGRIATKAVDEVDRYLGAERLQLRRILETHAHADHLSAAQELKRRHPAAVLTIGAGIVDVQRIFREVYDRPELVADGRQFDALVGDGETFTAGSLRIRALATPGHTPACMTYLIDDLAFVGDALFMPDYGVARCDFPGGDARTLYRSITTRLYALADATRVHTAHDYQPGGRPLRYEATVAEQKASNVHLSAQTTEADFVAFRTARDKTLDAPRLLHPSVQVNIDGGRLPEPAANGRRYLKIPLSSG